MTNPDLEMRKVRLLIDDEYAALVRHVVKGEPLKVVMSQAAGWDRAVSDSSVVSFHTRMSGKLAMRDADARYKFGYDLMKQAMRGTIEAMKKDIEDILLERGKRYGEFGQQAIISQELKALMRARVGWDKLDMAQQESLEMIQHKVARILNGDPNWVDSWEDIAGYAKLVADRLRK